MLGDLEPGTPLPSESQLAAQFGVSRLTVREAVKALQARGLILVHHGRRPVVAALGAQPISDFFTAIVRRDPETLIDLVELRRGLEVHIATLAAGRASRTAIEAMQAALDAMEAARGVPEALCETDVCFHESIAVATGNDVLGFLMEAMAGPLHKSRMESLRGHVARGRTVAELIDEHAQILEAIAAGDPRGAAAAMQIHLAETEQSLLAAVR